MFDDWNCWIKIKKSLNSIFHLTQLGLETLNRRYLSINRTKNVKSIMYTVKNQNSTRLDIWDWWNFNGLKDVERPIEMRERVKIFNFHCTIFTYKLIFHKIFFREKIFSRPKRKTYYLGKISKFNQNYEDTYYNLKKPSQDIYKHSNISTADEVIRSHKK